MKASTIKGLGTLVAGLLAVLAAPASAQLSTTANGPYYAKPSWDQKLTTNRFVILANWNNEAVLDRETGLVWQRAPSDGGRYDFVAETACAMSSTGGRSGWRLPSLSELMSLSEDNFSAVPATRKLPTGHPFTLPPFSGDTFDTMNYFWTLPLSDGARILARPDTFSFLGGDSTNSLSRIWCVRGSL